MSNFLSVKGHEGAWLPAGFVYDEAVWDTVAQLQKHYCRPDFHKHFSAKAIWPKICNYFKYHWYFKLFQ